MRTSTAQQNNQICPECGGNVAEDTQERGYSRHIDYGDRDYCDHEKGEKDPPPAQ